MLVAAFFWLTAPLPGCMADWPLPGCMADWPPAGLLPTTAHHQVYPSMRERRLREQQQQLAVGALEAQVAAAGAAVWKPPEYFFRVFIRSVDHASWR